MDRRNFLRRTTAATATFAAAAAGGVAVSGTASTSAAEPAAAGKPFALDYGPHFGMFRHLAGDDLVDQLKFAAERGFRSWEDNGMLTRPVADQERIAQAMERLGMRMGVISATRGTSDQVSFAGDDAAVRDAIVAQMHKVVEAAKRVRAKWLTAVLGDVNPGLEPDYQTVLVADLLKRCCDVVEPHGMVLVMEPLNRWTNHPGKFLWKTAQAYALCKAVARPSCKILFDVYHQQVSEGNLIANIDRAWDEIAYFQTGDNPGRKEPGTGEIHYANVFRHLKERGYTGVVGMEHGNSRPGAEGEQAVIDAYRAVDPV